MALEARADDDPRNTNVALRRELIANGWSDRALAHAVAAGQLVKPRRGAYVDAADWRRLDEAGRHAVTARAVLRNAGADAALSHVSAVPEYDGPVWGLDLRSVHLTRFDERAGRREAGVLQHRGILLPGDVVERNGVAVTSATRAALEVTTVAPVEPALCVVNHLLHHGLTTLQDLRRRYEQSMVGWPSSLRTDLVLRLASPLPETVGESRTLHLCWHEGLPRPEMQLDVIDDDGVFLGRVDFAWPELGVFVEFDGRVKYEKFLRPGERASDVVVREKRREEAICRATGWRCIRITWADLARPAQVAAMIRAAFRVPAGLS